MICRACKQTHLNLQFIKTKTLLSQNTFLHHLSKYVLVFICSKYEKSLTLQKIKTEFVTHVSKTVSLEPMRKTPKRKGRKSWCKKLEDRNCNNEDWHVLQATKPDSSPCNWPLPPRRDSSCHLKGGKLWGEHVNIQCRSLFVPAIYCVYSPIHRILAIYSNCIYTACGAPWKVEHYKWSSGKGIREYFIYMKICRLWLTILTRMINSSRVI